MHNTSKAYKYLDVITAVFVMVLLISNITAIKPVQLWSALRIEIDGGTLLFPISYIFGDVLVEVYGFARSRRVIWMGFGANVVGALIFSLVNALPAAPGWDMQAAFSAILGQTPRVVAASLLAYCCGEFVNALVMAKLKVKTAGRHLWMRTISSTVVGQAVDSALFTIVAFGWLWSWSLVGTVILWNYLFKVAFEILATPITYYIVGRLKKAEQEDYYDHHTDFNPFVFSP